VEVLTQRFLQNYVSKHLEPKMVVGVLLPEKESNPLSTKLATMQAKKMGLHTVTVDITATLDSFGTYIKRDEAIRAIFPKYSNKCKSKIVLPPIYYLRTPLIFSR